MSVLRKLKIDDAEQMLMWMHDESITKWFNKDFSSKNIENCIEFINDANTNCKKKMHLAITDINDRYCGTVSLKNIDENNRSAEFAIVLCKNAHGNGLAKQAYEEIIDISKRNLHLSLIYFSCMKNNVRANMFYKKMNAKCICVNDLLKKYNVVLKNYNSVNLEDLAWYVVD